MSPKLRKFALATHLTVSIGWIGTVMAYLALVLVAMREPTPQTLNAAWTAMAVIGWDLIVPLSIASLLTGIALSLGTHWGLFRYYWVIFSLVLTTFADCVLLEHMRSVDHSARTGASLGPELIHAGLGLAVLLTVQVLNIYKPRGKTGLGRVHVTQ